MKAFITVIKTLVIGLVLAVCLNMGPAQAETEGKPIAPRIPPVHWTTMLTNGLEATTAALVGVNTSITLQNYTPATVPSLPAVITSSNASCSKGNVAVGATLVQLTCNPGGQTITFRNNNATQNPSFLWVDLLNF